MSLDDLWRADATDLSQLLDSGAVDPVDLLKMYFDRCDRIEPKINAFVFLDRQGAMRAAEAASERHRKGQKLGVLDGIPVAIKDNIFVKNAPAAWGSLLYQDHIPAQDDIVVERLRAAGAVIIGKTTTPEFAMSGRTESRLSGVTRNPWDPTLTPGGSSGGAVAAVAAGLVPIAIATDAGGSTRLPASYTGLVGLRPSNGRIARCNGFPPMALDFQAIGIITRTVRDLSQVFRIVSGPDNRDPSSLAFSHHAARPEPKVIGWFDHVGTETIDPEVKTSFKEARTTLASAGYELVEVEPPYEIKMIRRVWEFLISAGAARNAHLFPDTWRTGMTAPMVQLAERGLDFSAADYAEAFDLLTELRMKCSSNWQGYDALLTPTGAAPAWAVEDEAPSVIDGEPGSPSRQSMFCGWVNQLGYAGLNLPGGPHSDGRPIGIQLVGRNGDDEVLLSIASKFEKIAPWAARWPTLASKA